MWRANGLTVAGLSVALVALWLVFTVAMRTEFRPVQDAVRRMNRAVLNPRTMETPVSRQPVHR